MHDATAHSTTSADILRPLRAGHHPWFSRWYQWRPELGTEVVAALIALWWSVSVNLRFLRAMVVHADLAPVAELALLVVLVLAIWAIHLLLLLVICARRWLRPVASLLIVAAVLVDAFARRDGVVLDPAMMRNVLHTHTAEAAELLSLSLLGTVSLHAALPLVVLWRVRLKVRRWPAALAARLGWLLAALLVLVGALLVAYQPLASTMRLNRDLRYLVTPANLVWSGAVALMGHAREATQLRKVTGADAAFTPAAQARTRPLLVVLVVGETARAANWGLNGYTRQTTPQLAARSVFNFPDTTSCGTHTEASLPCMFAPVGRRDYDEARIRGSESLLHMLARAGVSVQWRDNQSGCKGVCDGLPQTQAHELPTADCPAGRCLDETLLLGLDPLLRDMAGGHGTHLLVLHQIGNHGPAYHRRYPAAFEQHRPACRHDDLHRCSRAEIVNAYDNALLYTDHVLSRLIDGLQARAAAVDSVMIYVSDHGESLGEAGLYLHGLPWAIAPDLQKKVPMVMWGSGPSFAGLDIDRACLAARASRPTSHDHLFHTIAGLLGVHSQEVDPRLDLAAPCRPAGAELH
ncbi:MAG: phosphoethanolamine transferase [Aquabacterium sp.]